MIQPMLSSLTDSGGMWRQRVYDRAYEAFSQWQSVSPLMRLNIQSELETPGIVRPAHVLLEQRSVRLLLQAIPDRLKTEIALTRTLSSTMIFYKLFTVYQPGGANERGRMLTFLAQLSEAIKGVRQWAQWTEGVNAAEPDATLLIKGLDSFSATLLAKHPTVLLRAATFREKLAVDYSPTSETATQLAEMLQAEFELLLHRSGDQEVKQDSEAKEIQEKERGRSIGSEQMARNLHVEYMEKLKIGADLALAANFAKIEILWSVADALSVVQLAMFNLSVHIRTVPGLARMLLKVRVLEGVGTHAGQTDNFISV